MTAIDEDMQRYFVQLRETEKRSVLQMVKTFVPERGKDEESAIEKYNRDIEEAEAEIERGESFSHSEVVEMSNGWLHGT